MTCIVPNRSRILILTGLLFLGGRPAAAQDQPYSAVRDPVIRSSVQAQREQRYADAEKILAAAVAAAEKTAPNPQLAFYLNDLASLYQRKGDGVQAVNLAQRALENDRSLYGRSDIRLAPLLAFTAGLLRMQHRTGEADQFLQQAVELIRQAPNPDLLPPDTRAGVLVTAATNYAAAGRLGEATLLYEDAVKFCAGVRVGPLCDQARLRLADLYRSQGRLAEAAQLPAGMIPAEFMDLDRQGRESMRNRLYVQAELNYRSAIQWIEGHPKANVQGLLGGEWAFLGQALEAQGRGVPAEEAYLKSFDIQVAHVDPKVPNSADSFVALPSLTNLYRRQGRIREMEPLLQRALSVQEKAVGPEHAYLAETLMQLARIYEEEAKTDAARYSAAIPLYERALKIQEKSFGPDSQQLVRVLTGYAGVLRAAHQDAQAAEMQSRLDALRNRNPPATGR